MLIGSGMLARAFAPVSEQLPGLYIHAAGVSNSACRDEFEFDRERVRLLRSLENSIQARTLVYFGTCSVYDPMSCDTPYVRHKLAMEELAAAHPRALIVRLPQVAGRTPNPHTLLNFLYARVSRSERFVLWKNARRNIIDIVDVVAIVRALLERPSQDDLIVNVANFRSYPIDEIVSAMEYVTGKAAITEVLDNGGSYDIDTTAVAPIVARLGLRFNDAYLPGVIAKYYDDSATAMRGRG